MIHPTTAGAIMPRRILRRSVVQAVEIREAIEAKHPKGILHRLGGNVELNDFRAKRILEHFAREVACNHLSREVAILHAIDALRGVNKH